MEKNILFVLLVAIFVSGCAGALPEKSWTEFRAEQKAIEPPESKIQKRQVSKKEDHSGLQVKKTYIPSDGVKGSVSYNGIGMGVEVHDDNHHYHGDTTVIKPFSGTRGPDYNRGKRDEKENARFLKERQLLQRALDLAMEHAEQGYMSYAGVPGKYYPEYKRAYEYYENYANRRDLNEYRNQQYEEGVMDFRIENPEYGEFVNLAEQLESKARRDAQSFQYDLPAGLSLELEEVYYNSFMLEAKLFVREKAERDAKRNIFEPPYEMPDFVEYYEKVYEKNNRSHNQRRRR